MLLYAFLIFSFLHLAFFTNPVSLGDHSRGTQVGLLSFFMSVVPPLGPTSNKLFPRFINGHVGGCQSFAVISDATVGCTLCIKVTEALSLVGLYS